MSAALLLAWLGAQLLGDPCQGQQISEILEPDFKAKPLEAAVTYSFDTVPDPGSLTDPELDRLDYAIYALTQILRPERLSALRPTIHRARTSLEWDAFKLVGDQNEALTVYLVGKAFLFAVDAEKLKSAAGNRSASVNAREIVMQMFLPCIDVLESGTGKALYRAPDGLMGYRLHFPARHMIRDNRHFFGVFDYGNFGEHSPPPLSPSLLDLDGARQVMARRDPAKGSWFSYPVRYKPKPTALRKVWPDWMNQGGMTAN